MASEASRRLYSNGVHAGRGCWSLFDLLLGACIVQSFGENLKIGEHSLYSPQ